MATCTTGALALHPMGNAQGGYYFMSLTTGRHLNHNHWTPLLMPQEVIKHVHILACRNPLGLTFGNRHGQPDPDDSNNDDDSTYDPDDDSACIAGEDSDTDDDDNDDAPDHAPDDDDDDAPNEQ